MLGYFVGAETSNSLFIEDFAAMWNLERNLAQVQQGDFAAQVDLTAPNIGLQSVLTKQALVAGSLLGFQFEGTKEPPTFALTESYVRHADLVATYTELSGRHVRPQIYWREVTSLGAPLFGIETILSMQTSLLDSNPTLTTVSELPTVEVRRLVDEKNGRFATIPKSSRETTLEASTRSYVLLCRLPEPSLSYAEMVFPADFCGAVIQRKSADTRLRFRLFQERLEKGVIRRCRVLGVFLSRENDEAAALQCFRQFADSPLPLTT